MNRLIFIPLLVSLWIAAAGASSVKAQNFNLDEVAFSVEPGSVISFVGNSAVAPFRCESVDIDGVGRAGRAHEETGEPFVEAMLSTSVRAFDCQNAELSTELQNALKHRTNPEVLLMVDDAFVRQATEFEGGDYSLRVVGQLKIAGIERAVDLHLIAEREGFLTFRLKGSHEVLLANYGVSPPAVFLDSNDSKNQVKLEFNLVLSPDMSF